MSDVIIWASLDWANKRGIGFEPGQVKLVDELFNWTWLTNMALKASVWSQPEGIEMTMC